MANLSTGSADKQSYRTRSSTRSKNPTQKALQNFWEEETKLAMKEESAWKRFQDASHLFNSAKDQEELKSHEKELKDSFLRWKSLRHKRVQILQSINSHEAEVRLQRLIKEKEQNQRDFGTMLEKIGDFEPAQASSLKSSQGKHSKSDSVESARSHSTHQSEHNKSHSRSSRTGTSHASSSQSWRSAAAVQQYKAAERLKVKAGILQAQAEAAMAEEELAFSHKEAELQAQQAELKAQQIAREAELQAQQAELKAHQVAREAELKAQQIARDAQEAELEAKILIEEKMLQKAKEAAKLAVKAKIFTKTLQDELSEENVKLLPKEDVSVKMSTLMSKEDIYVPKEKLFPEGSSARYHGDQDTMAGSRSDQRLMRRLEQRVVKPYSTMPEEEDQYFQAKGRPSATEAQREKVSFSTP